MKIKLGGNGRFDEVVISYLAAANWLSAIVFESKEMNPNRLQRAHYATIRRNFGLMAQLTCSVISQVASIYKSGKALGRWKKAKFQKPTFPIRYGGKGKDFSRKGNGIRIWKQFIPMQHPHIPEAGWKGSILKRVGKIWYLLLAYEVDIPDHKTTGSIIGVDFGINRLMVATNSANSNTFYFKGGMLNHRRCCIRQTRSAVQAVGSRSSRRLLKRLSGHEAAVTGHLLHVASKALVRYAVENGAQRIVLEDLTNIRDRSLKRGKDHRSKIGRWPFWDGQFKIAYKAQAVGIDSEKVSPRNTSCGCPRCGHVSASNRRGLRFACVKCGYRGDADRVASENIRLRSVVAAQRASTTGNHNLPESSEPSEIGSGHINSRLSGADVGSRLKPVSIGG